MKTTDDQHQVCARAKIPRLFTVYAPILDRLEAELAEMQRRQRPVDRARAILEAYTVDGGVKAIGGLEG